MHADPIVKETRTRRKQLEQAANNDLATLVKQLQTQENSTEKQKSRKAIKKVAH